MNRSEVYRKEVKIQIEFAKRAYQELLRARDGNDTAGVFYHGHHFLIHAINIGKIIHVKPDSFRSSYVKDLVKNSKADLKWFRSLRNHLEHFDERLDIWIKDHEGSAFFDMNIITNAKGFPKKAFLRALDGDEFRFYGEAYNLAELLLEIEKVERALKVMGNKK